MSVLRSFGKSHLRPALALSMALMPALLWACTSEPERPPPHGGSGGGSSGGTDGEGGDGPGGLGGSATGGAGTGGATEGSGGQIIVGDDCSTVRCEEFNPNFACYDDGDVAECRCKPGFGGADCVDINECNEAGACDDSAVCNNFSGGHSCTCLPGYVGSGDSCTDQNECASDALNGCAAGADCTEEDGSYACECPSDQYGDGFFCKAQDDCALDPCQNGGECENTPGGAKCLCPLGWSGDLCQTSCATITFDDPLVEQAVRSATGKVEGDILPGDLQYATSLNLPQGGEEAVTSLGGLECWPTLQYLYVGDNDVSDLAPLQSLHALQVLDLNCNPLASLAPLAQLSSLRELRVAQDGFCEETEKLDDDDAAALEDLVALEILDLSGHQLTHLDMLSSLSRLEYLNVSDNLIESASGIEGLPGLSRFLASGNLIDDLAPLATLPALREVRLDENGIVSVEDLGGALTLSVLDLADNALSDLGPLSTLSNLSELDLSWNGAVSSLEPVAQLAGLLSLRISGTYITSLEPLVDNPDFGHGGELWIADTQLECSTQEPFMQTLSARGLSFIGECVY